MKPLMVWGSAAFSRFRLDALSEKITAALAAAKPVRIEAQFVYLLDVSRQLDAPTLERACTLLGAAASEPASGGFFVTPRKGTISPWSSKATDIFRNCGLAEVNRVERGVHLRVVAPRVERPA